MQFSRLSSALVALALCSSLAVAAKSAPDCGLNKPFEITSRSQLFDLANGDHSLDPTPCPGEIRTAIKELSLIVDDNENVCSQEKANRIRDFHAIYLDENDKKTTKLPQPVEQFFVAYALKVSQLCRRLAIDSLVAASNSLLKPDDFRLVNEKSIFAKLISEPSDYDNLVLPKNLVRMLRSRGERVNDQEKVFLQLGTIKTVGHLRRDCANKFRPIYEKLLLPLVTISSSGYNFNDASSDVTDSTAEPKQVGKLVYQWYRVTMLCEILDNIELVSAKPGEQNSNVVRILSKKEAEELREASPASDESQEEAAQAEEPLAFEPSYASKPQIDDLVIDQGDKNFLKKIRSFKESNSVARFLRKLSRTVKEQLAAGVVRLAISKGAVISAAGEKVESANDLVKAIDDQVYLSEHQGQSAVAQSNRRPVSIKFQLTFALICMIIVAGFSALIIGVTGGFSG